MSPLRRATQAFLFTLLFALSACGEQATLPDAPGLRAEAGPSREYNCAVGVYCLEPITVEARQTCDPWLQVDWSCEDDAGCLMTAGGGGQAGLASCPGGGGTGGGGEPDPTDDPYSGGGTAPGDTTGTCDPIIDLSCEQPLTDADRALLAYVLKTYLRPASQFTDSQAAQECQEMTEKFEHMFASGDVMRGNYDTQADHGLGVTPHYGAYNERTQNIHFDPQYLDAAAGGSVADQKEIAKTALHEAAHALGFQHGDPVYMGGIDLYADPYFSRLNPGSNSCLNF
ncbi:MAG TPA: hypothetical protein VFQ45_09285 [Longimicrobium sp.]|nr:hypothetical protein [Longimicrobium sp.]